jgi:hypothetical protein
MSTWEKKQMMKFAPFFKGRELARTNQLIMCNCKFLTVMMLENKPKQEKGADPRILLYVGSDKEKLLKQNNRTVV